MPVLSGGKVIRPTVHETTISLPNEAINVKRKQVVVQPSQCTPSGSLLEFFMSTNYFIKKIN